MKFTCTVSIEQSVEKVVALFQNPENMQYWQDGFPGMEHRSGSPGKPGAQSNMRYRIGKREIDLLETILVSQLPREFTARYEAVTLVNTMKNTFSAPNPGQTVWTAEIE